MLEKLRYPAGFYCWSVTANDICPYALLLKRKLSWHITWCKLLLFFLCFAAKHYKKVDMWQWEGKSLTWTLKRCVSLAFAIKIIRIHCFTLSLWRWIASFSAGHRVSGGKWTAQARSRRYCSVPLQRWRAQQDCHRRLPWRKVHASKICSE